jgi:hypothetical protein
MEEFGGAGVDEEVEVETQAEEDVGGVLVGGHARVTHGSEEDGVEFVAKHGDRALRESDVVLEIPVGTPIELDKLDGAVAFAGGHPDDFEGLGSYLLADTVTGNDGDAGFGTTAAKGCNGHELGLHGVGTR